MKKLLSFLKSIAVDKVAHFGAGYIITNIITLVLLKLQCTNLVTYFIAISTSTVIAILKEIYDLNIKKTMITKNDIYATILGAILSACITLVFVI